MCEKAKYILKNGPSEWSNQINIIVPCSSALRYIYAK